MSARAGVVYLVGAGPGDPGLMTARSLELLASADTILHDRLIPAGALDGARDDAELVYVGKRPGDNAIEQDEIEALMVERARAGRSVVRLKGGDPFVFGRGGEEAETLAAAGVEFEVVPGVTAGVAAPAYAGIPVTHRDDASAVAFVTGHEDPEKPETALDWEALARFPGTLVLYMGVKNLPLIAERLAAAGRDPAEPAAAIERGTEPGQRTVSATLAELPARGRRGRRCGPRRSCSSARSPRAARRSPGSSAGRCTASAWSSPAPGRRPAGSPRPCTGSAPRWSSCRRSGSSRCSGPTAVRDAVADLHTYALVCLTSPNGVRLLFEAMAAQGRDARALANATVAAIGPGTAAALAARGVIADIVPERFVAEALVEALAAVEVADRPVLVARAAEARDVLPEALAERGADVDVVALYETVRERPEPGAVEAAADGRLRHLHLLLDGPQPARRGRRRVPPRCSGRLDRPDHQRHRPRARARGSGRGRAPRRRGAGRGAGRRRRRLTPAALPVEPELVAQGVVRDPVSSATSEIVRPS